MIRDDAKSVPGRLWPRSTGTVRRPRLSEARNLACGLDRARLLLVVSTTRKPRVTTLPGRSTTYEGGGFREAGGRQGVGRVIVPVCKNLRGFGLLP